MNGDLQLKLQSWVDGELAGDEARRVESMVAENPAAAALAAELRMTRAFLADNEVARTVSDSREFYWSRIRREIERAEAPVAAPAAAASFWGAFRRFMVPASGLALVMLVAALSVKYFSPATLEDAVQMIEVEDLSEEMGSASYRSHAGNMFVVFVYSKDQAVAEEESQPESLDDLLFQ